MHRTRILVSIAPIEERERAKIFVTATHSRGVARRGARERKKIGARVSFAPRGGPCAEDSGERIAC
jgi:hypothetical protein